MKYMFFNYGYFFLKNKEFNKNKKVYYSILIGFFSFLICMLSIIASLFLIKETYYFVIQLAFPILFLMLLYYLLFFCHEPYLYNSKKSFNLNYDKKNEIIITFKILDKLKDADKLNFIHIFLNSIKCNEYYMTEYKKDPLNSKLLNYTEIKNLKLLDNEFKKRNMDFFNHCQYISDEEIYIKLMKDKKELIMKEKYIVSKIYANKEAQKAKWKKDKIEFKNIKDKKLYSKIENT